MTTPMSSADQAVAREPTGISVLVAHRDALIAAGLSATLGEQQFTVVVQAPSSAGDLFLPTDVAVADYESGLRLLDSRDLWRERVIILTHRETQSSICQALQQGAGGYLLLGCSVAALVTAIRSVHAGRKAMDPVVAARIAERVTLPLLTKREADVLRQIDFGLSNRGIGLALSLSVGTVKTHVKSILTKLGAVSRTHAVAMARFRGVLPEEGREQSQVRVAGRDREARGSRSSRLLECEALAGRASSLLKWIAPRAQIAKRRS
jgi:DNA-binding NarL/FixJ family response regulator